MLWNINTRFESVDAWDGALHVLSQPVGYFFHRKIIHFEADNFYSLQDEFQHRTVLKTIAFVLLFIPSLVLMVPLTFALNRWNATFQELQAKFQAKYTAASRQFVSATPLHNPEYTPLTLTQLFKRNKDLENCILARLDLVALGNLSLTCKTFFNKYAPHINKQINRDYLKNTRAPTSFLGFVCGEFRDNWMEEISLRPQSTPVDCLNSYIRNVKAIRLGTILELLDPLTIIKNDYLCLLRPSAYKTHNFVTWEMMYRCIGLPFNFHRREEVDFKP